MPGRLRPELRAASLVDLFVSLSPSERALEFLTTGDAARWCGMSRRTVIDWINGGSVKAIRLGKRYLVSRASLRGKISDLS